MISQLTQTQCSKAKHPECPAANNTVNKVQISVTLSIT